MQLSLKRKRTSATERRKARATLGRRVTIFLVYLTGSLLQPYKLYKSKMGHVQSKAKQLSIDQSDG